jgi:hypothetical protein
MLFVGVGLLACQTTSERMEIRTSPPDFSYLPPKRLESSMWILAAEVKRLDELLRVPADPHDARLQHEVRDALRRMAAAVEQIDQPGRTTTQHPALDRHLQRFAERLTLAQRGAAHDPPNYFYASTLSGSCFLCHDS